MSTTDRHVKLTVKLAYGSVAELLAKYGHLNFTPDGLFVRSREPKPAGTRVVLKLQLSHGELVLQGAGRVAWARAPGDPSGPPGMGVELETVDPAGRRLLHLAQAGQATGLLAANRPLDIPPPPGLPVGLAVQAPSTEPLVVRLGDAEVVQGAPLPEDVAPGPSEELLLPPEAGFDDEFDRLLNATPGPLLDFEPTRPAAAEPPAPPRSLWSRLRRAVGAKREED